jgi:hypothetical protein
MIKKFLIGIIFVMLIIGTIGCFEEENTDNTDSNNQNNNIDNTNNETTNETDSKKFKKEQLIGIWDITYDGTGFLELNETIERYVFFNNSEIKLKFYNVNTEESTHTWGEYKIEGNKLNITFSGFNSKVNFTMKNENTTLILFNHFRVFNSQYKGNAEFTKTNSSTDSEKEIDHPDYEEEDLIGTWQIESVYSPLIGSSYYDDYNSTWIFYNNGTSKEITNHPSFGVENTTNWYNYSFTDDGNLIKEFIKGDTIHSQKTEIFDFEFFDDKNKFTIDKLRSDTYKKVT